jgi:DNA polymerase I-like protein with 3'-5' exonuclease and polymerase domains
MVHLIKETGKDFDDALSFLSQLKSIGVDTETTGLNSVGGKVLLVQMGNAYQQYVFDVARLGDGIQKIKPLLINPDITKIMHNAKFDYKFIKYALDIETENIYDSMLAEQLLQKGRKLSGYSLETVAEKYTGVKLDKDVRKSFYGLIFGENFTEAQIEYAAADVKHLHEIMEKQLPLLNRDGLTEVAKIEMDVIQATGDMELNGMKIDKIKWLAAEAIAKTERQEALKKLDTMFGPFVAADMFGKPSINYNSPKQLLKVLQVAVDPKITSTSEDALKDINHPIVESLLYYRGMEKRVTTYGEPFLKYINELTGRIHSDFEQLNTDTGRYSSNNPNLQNIPVKDTPLYREAFVAFDDECILVDADYSNMELRILADLSQEPKWLEIFEKGLDMHCEIGSMLFGKPIRLKGTLGPDDPGENISLRKITKSINFGVGYGMGPQKLAREVKVSFPEAKQLLNKYWTSFPKVKAFFDGYVSECVKNKCVRAPYDKRLRWLEGFDLDSQRELARVRNMTMNFPMQAGNASITKLALTETRKEIKKRQLPAQIICTIHDEIILNSKKTCAKEAEQVLQKCMLDAAKSYVKNVKVKVESTIAPYWKK